MKPELALSWIVAAYALGRVFAPEAAPVRLDPSALPEMRRETQAQLARIQASDALADRAMAELVARIGTMIPDRPPADMRRDR